MKYQSVMRKQRTVTALQLPMICALHAQSQKIIYPVAPTLLSIVEEIDIVLNLALLAMYHLPFELLRRKGLSWLLNQK